MNTLTASSQAPSPQVISPCDHDLSADAGFVYAIGLLKPFFPSLDLQQQFLAAAGQIGAKPDDYYQVFNYQSNPENPNSYRPFLYIAEQVCWILSINNVDTYIAVPRAQLELNGFIDALKPPTGATSSQPSLSLVIGTLGPLAPPHYCAGLRLPIVVCEQFNQPNATIEAAAKALNLKPNDGTSDVDRAVNFLALNYAQIIAKTAELAPSSSDPLVSIGSQFITTDSGRTVVDVVLKYQNTSTAAQRFYACGIDITDQYPFVETPLRIYLPTD